MDERLTKVELALAHGMAPTQTRQTADESRQRVITAGDCVTLHGLKSKPELNGKTAVCVRLSNPGRGNKRRWIVKLVGDTTEFSVRPENAAPIGTDTADRAAWERTLKTDPTLGPAAREFMESRVKSNTVVPDLPQDIGPTMTITETKDE